MALAVPVVEAIVIAAVAPVELGARVDRATVMVELGARVA